jgi:glycosyltransferase involved in cell wall biosynthesis
MKIAATGFVSSEAGSVASANALLLKGLLQRGHQIDFFSKPSFVDPRPVVGEHQHFRFYDCTNKYADRLRRLVQRIPVLGSLTCILDAYTYNQLLLRQIGEVNRAGQGPYDVVLWMGDYAHGRIQGVPAVSFVQGPPGTDARSVLRRRKEIRQLSGLPLSLLLELLARLRLSPIGLPHFDHSDHIIVGSSQSKTTLMSQYAIRQLNVSTIPYPVDLEMFRPAATHSPGSVRALRVLWLGRIVPRKRLDLFLDGAAEAIKSGLDIKLTVVGGMGFVPGYDKLLKTFPFPMRLEHISNLPRKDIPSLLARHDVLCQPSEEENFGSSVAEAQACGLPVIVGQSNGNADYLCERDIQLSDSKSSTLGQALSAMLSELNRNANCGVRQSRQLAERVFGLSQVVGLLEQALLKAQIAGTKK